MIEGRYILDEEDLAILNKIKEEIAKSVKELQERNIRSSNIQIELEWYIRGLLKHE